MDNTTLTNMACNLRDMIQCHNKIIRTYKIPRGKINVIYLHTSFQMFQ
jgi:hypothetical protein